MSGPSPGKPGFWRGGPVVFLLWITLFAILLVTLPRWSLRIHCDEPIDAQIITDDSSTLVAFSVRLGEATGQLYPTWPIRLIGLTTGQERVLNPPEESGEPSEIRDEFGTLYRTAGKQTLHTIEWENGIQQSGDYVAITYETIDDKAPEKRLQVLNWRSGDVALDAPFEGIYRFFGPRLLVSQHDGGSRLEIWTPAAKTIEPADWLVGFQDLDSTIVSPDGRWLTLRGSTVMWDLARGEERLTLPKGTEDAVFSRDSARIVLVTRFEREGRGRPVRQWRCLDTHSGTLLREEQEMLEWPDNRSPPRGPGDLRFLSDDQTVHYDQAGGATEWSTLGTRRLEESSEDDEAADSLLDARWDFVARSVDEKWAVATLRPQPIMSTFYDMVLLFLFPKGTVSMSSPFPYQLWRLDERRPISSLGRGSTERCWFTPDSRRVVTQTARELLVWDVPPSRPWFKAFLWSLLLPAAASLGAFLRSRPSRLQRPGATDSR